MKTILLSFIFSLLSCFQIKAQDVYRAIYDSAKESFENPSTTGILKEISQFKLDALDYMLLKMREEMPDSSAFFLDKEAYALHNFLTFYTNILIEMRNEPSIKTIEVIKIFMDASYSNPLFNDSDTELVYTYYGNKDSMTRFSLDTDWRRAYLAASALLKNWREKNAKRYH